MITKLLVFTTYTDEHGTKYYLDKETVLTEKTYYLRINAQSGAFHVTASVPSADITGSLHKAGLEISMVNGSNIFMSTLDTSDSFTGIAMNGNITAVFQPNIMYRITMLAAHDIEGENKVEETPDFTLRFDATPVDSYTVVFKDDDKVIETRMIEKNKPLGKLPDAPKREGWTFDGWFDENGEQVFDTTIVTRDMEVHSNWSRSSTFEVVFSDRGRIIETRMIEKDQPLGKLPEAPEREGWTFDGWFDDKENRVHATTIVTGDMQIHSKWSQEPTPPPGPPTPHDKETREEEVIVEPDGTEITIISDLIERVDGTYDL
jgi:uncharacterized repeat protein (TIGR02543 family)